MVFPAVWAAAPDGTTMIKAPATAMAKSVVKLRIQRRIISAFLATEGMWRTRPVRSIAERAAVLARIGAAGQRALVPVDPDRLTAAERRNHAAGLMPELLQALDNVGGHAVLELIDAFVMQAARHIDRLLHVATVVEQVGQHMGLTDRLVLPAHHAKRHHRATIFRDEAGDDRVQRPLARRDAIGMAGLHPEPAAAILQENAGVVGNDR